MAEPSLFEFLETMVYRLCGRFGHWFYDVEDDVRKCHVCRCLVFGERATQEQLRRNLVG